MLSDLLEVCQRIFLTLHDRRHPPECGFFQLLAPIQRVAKLEETDIIFRDLGDKMTSCVELTEGELVMILIVQDVEERR